MNLMSRALRVRLKLEQFADNCRDPLCYPYYGVDARNEEVERIIADEMGELLRDNDHAKQ